MTEIVIAASIIGLSAVAIVALILMARNQTATTRLEKQISSIKITLPLRLQAYERCLLFLERISPDSIIIRVNKPDYTVQQLQAQLLSTIRSEFEHNLAQQLYVSPEAWTYLVNAKNNIIGLINSSSMKLTPELKSADLARLILESYANLETSPSQFAKQRIKREVAELF